MKKFLLGMTILVTISSMPTIAFAQEANNQTLEIPVVGQIGRWKDSNTDITNPSNPDSGSEGENGEVNKPSDLTNINVTVPTSMTFDVVVNTTNSNPVLASGEYTVTNNGDNAVEMSAEYNVIDEGGINLVDNSLVNAKGDEKIELSLDLCYKTSNESYNKFIENVKNRQSSIKPVNINNNESINLKFSSDEKGLSDIKQEAMKGTFAKKNKITTGNLVLTFKTKE